MALKLYIHPCIHKPPHHLHPPQADKPLRIRIQGPLESIQKLLPNVSWDKIVSFPQPGGLELASITHQALYGWKALRMANGALMVWDEYLAWVMEGRRALDHIDYYGVTFDHLVPADDPDPEVFAINIIEVDNDGGKYANEVLSFSVNPTDYTGSKVLAVPRCCQRKKGTQDRRLINGLVAERDSEVQRCS
ncbi:hypothetical protein BDY21DRAFT_279573 [Lineolata rhizophorae]|uniref:Uncharacterized protein n=1 Tax=Lineolata rhizophorae TaxID=578093 RepID=A0A6A6PA91_9PEZI|nr:hypothetical protein BDY21DRAFT_279573 [Lineolata rhizophorae]